MRNVNIRTGAAVLAAIVVQLAVLPSPANAQVQAPAAARAAAPTGFYQPPPMLGVNMDIGYLWTGYQSEPGIRIVNVWPGYPAYGRLDPGDVITRVNGMRVTNLDQFRFAMANANGALYLRVRDIRTGTMMDLDPIFLFNNAPPAAAAAAPAYTPTQYLRP
jgi:S1-C subfamily serine protease